MPFDRLTVLSEVEALTARLDRARRGLSPYTLRSPKGRRARRGLTASEGPSLERNGIKPTQRRVSFSDIKRTDRLMLNDPPAHFHGLPEQRLEQGTIEVAKGR